MGLFYPGIFVGHARTELGVPVHKGSFKRQPLFHKLLGPLYMIYLSVQAET